MDEQVTVVLTYAIDQQDQQLLQRVSPRVRLLPIGPLVRQEYLLITQGEEDTDEYRRVKSELDAALAQAEVLLLWREPRNLAQRVPKVKWVQIMSVGVDNLAQSELSRIQATITDASGNTSRQMAESVLGAMLYFVKRLPELLDHQRRHVWNRRIVLSGLAGKTVGIVGLGHIGREVAQLARAFDMRVLATKRSVQDLRQGVEGVERIYPPEELDELLSASDFVALTLPLTPETEGFINADRLKAMRPTSYLVNVSRGKLVDEAALIVALKEERLAGAALDVFQLEPLPDKSELWDMSNVLISPHVSGNVDTWAHGTIELMAKNLERYLTGQPLERVIDPSLVPSRPDAESGRSS
jgi:phosphoglycerate dehydrogenase-like enzyme